MIERILGLDGWILVIAAAVLVGIVAFSLYKAIKAQRTLDRVEKMLKEAMEGDFSESEFTEDRTSKLESVLADYLRVSALSAKSVKEDRDKIKTLIADISHQTKTPITNLLLHSELLKESELTADQKDSLDAISNEAEKLRFLIDALVKLSRLENGILVIEPKPDDLGRLVKEIVNTLRLKAEEKGLYLKAVEGSVAASFDYKWTLEAIGNIVENAIKYTDKGGIEITLGSTEMFSYLSVKDTGIGIKEEDIAKIFARFGRLSSSKEKEGVGIGLYLAREIISKEGGYIKVKSKPGEGSEFLVYLKK